MLTPKEIERLYSFDEDPKKIPHEITNAFLMSSGARIGGVKDIQKAIEKDLGKETTKENEEDRTI